MKQFKIIVLLIATSLLLCACPEKESGHRYITFVNKSERKIACQMLWSGHITEADTLYQCRIPSVGITVDSQYNFPCGNSDRGKSWEDDFKTIPYIQFLVMDGDIYKEYIITPDCDTIRKYVPILRTYRLTLKDLERMNWTVVYPPEE